MSNLGKYAFKLVETIINKIDPIGLLKNGAPSDEYYEEIERIIPLIECNRDKIELGKVIYNIFVENFDKEIAGDSNIYLKIAEEIIDNLKSKKIKGGKP